MTEEEIEIKRKAEFIMTEIEVMTNQIKEAEESKSSEKAMDLAKYYAWKVIELNAMGRAVERAVRKECGEEKFAAVMKASLQERLAGDEFTEAEEKFYEDQFTIWD